MAIKLLAIAGVALALIGAFLLLNAPESRLHGEVAIGVGILIFVVAWVSRWKRHG